MPQKHLRVLSTAAPNLRSTAWRHKKVASLPGAIGFGAAGPASNLSQADTPVALVTSPVQLQSEFYCGNTPNKEKQNKKRNNENSMGVSLTKT